MDGPILPAVTDALVVLTGPDEEATTGAHTPDIAGFEFLILATSCGNDTDCAANVLDAGAGAAVLAARLDPSAILSAKDLLIT